MTLDHPRFAGFQRHRAARDLVPGEEYLEPVRNHIVTYGWHVQSVFGDAGRFGWNYTVGLGDSLGHPDLVVYGLDPGVGHVLLNDIGDALADGRQLSEGKRHDGFLRDVDVQFQPTLQRWNPAHFGRALDWYGSYPPMWQVVVPDVQNRFPGDPGEEASRFQLLLSTEQPAPEPLSHAHTPIDVEDGWTALVADRIGGDESGWEELVVLVPGANPGRWVVVSVPFVDHLGFGDEVEAEDEGVNLRLTRTTQRGSFATARMCILKGGEATQQRVSDLIDVAEANEVVWESPARHWFFFAVPHHRYDWFIEAAQLLQQDGLVSLITSRPPAP